MARRRDAGKFGIGRSAGRGLSAMHQYMLTASLLLVYVVFSTAGLALLKLSHGLPPLLVQASLPPAAFLLAAGFALYAGSFAIWTWLLGRLPLTVAFPVASGATLAATSVTACLLFDERMTSLKSVGIGLVFLGVVALTAPSK
jgi:multidrug transporter EmrE-like cation transporter